MPARPVIVRKAERGMTLVEVLAAMTVLAIALIAIFRAVDSQIRNTATLADRMFAHWAALNSMEEARLAGPADAHDGERSTELGGIVWTITTHREPAPYGLTRIQVVSSAEGHAGAMLTGFLSPEAAQ